jgi:proteasome accessory factor C
MVAYVDGDEVVVDMADYFSRSVPLTPAEALGLLAAGMALVSTGQAPPALHRAVDKLAAVLVPDAGDALAVELPGEPELVEILRAGAAEGRVVDILYTSLAKGETRRRTIEPWSVFSAMGNWYVSGFCRTAGAERIFRVDRIQEAALGGQRFSPPEEPPRPEVRYTPSEDDVRATILLRPRARWVADYYPVDVLAENGDTMEIRFSASDASVAARLLLRLGPDAELVEGDEVARRLADLQERILARYGEVLE